MNYYDVNETNYKSKINESIELLNNIFSFLHEASNSEHDYFNDQYIINFQDKLNEYSIMYAVYQDVDQAIKEFSTYVEGSICKKNDKVFREFLTLLGQGIFDKLLENKKIAAYEIVSDETNNTPEVLDKGVAAVTLRVQRKVGDISYFTDTFYTLNDKGERVL